MRQLGIQLLVLILALTCQLIAQDKPVIVKIDSAKVAQRLAQLEKGIQERQKEVFDTDPKIQQMVNIYRGLAMSINDKSLAYIDSVLASPPKKK